MLRRLSLLLLWCLFGITLYAQTPAVDIPLTVTDGVGGNASLRFGLDPSATDGLDPALGEQTLPPLPPTGVFDARFALPSSTESSLKDYRQGSISFQGQITHTIQWQLGTGSTGFVINWNMPTYATALLQDLFGGVVVNVPVSGQGNYTVTNSGITQLKLIVTYAGGGSAPSAPVLSLPANGAVSIAVNPTLKWFKSTGATSYRLQVSTNQNFTSFVVNDSTITDSLKQISGLANNTMYYWRVNAKNSIGTSVYSAVWNFTTVAGGTAPSAPVLQAPVNGATGQPTSLTLSWNASSGADKYNVQVSTNSSFTTFVVNDTNVTTTTKAVSGLTANTTYYWRVNAKNAFGTSSWSTVWNFATQGVTPGLVYDLPLTVTDGTGNQTLKFGIAADATDGIDSQYGEAPLPPMPPTGVFDARFNLPVNNDASLKDYRQGSSGVAVTKIYEVAYQVGTGTTITLGWNLPANVTGRLNDYVTGTVVDVPMSGTGSYIVTNPSGLTKLKMTINYPGGTQPPAAPVLLAPANGATNQETSLTLSWNASSGADKYNVQVSTSSSFTSFVVNDTNVTTTSKAISGLANSTQYYWRVNAKNSSGTSDWSTVWNFTTKAGQPGLVYDLPLTVTDGTGNQTLRFGIAPDATDGIDSQYGEAPLPPMPPTGVFDARFNLPVNNDASLKDYRQGSSGVAVTKIYEVAYQVGTGTTITLGWNLPANVTGRLNDYVTGTVVDVPMSGTGSYIVTNPSGLTKLKMTINYPGGAQPPAAPVLLAPANGATNQETSLTLSWNASSGADKYNVQVSTSSSFTTFVVNDTNVTTTSKAISGLANSTQYYWRVNAKNSSGTSSWSTVWNFTTKAGQPGLVYDLPLTVTDGTGNQTLRFGIAPDATDGIDSQYGEAPLPPMPPTGVFDARFNLPVNNDASLKDYRQGSSGVAVTKIYEVAYQVGTGTTITLGWNLPSTVNGRLNDYVTGTVVDVPMTGTGSYIVTNPSGLAKLKMTINYTGQQMLEPPVLISPANNATEQPTTVTLKWNASANATKYTVQVSTSQSFSTFVVNDTNVTATSKEVSGLSNSTTYYWRVMARNATLSSQWSTVWNFATMATPQPPAAPVLVAPVNHAISVPVSPALSWNASATATLYHVQVAKDAAFTQLVANDSGVTTVTTTVGPLAYQTMFYWRVRAKNTVGWGTYSTVWDFTTLAAPPAYDIPLVVTDSAGGTLELRFGMAPTATDGLDTLLGEYPLPPLPPTGVFDARFLLPVGNEAAWRDYRKGWDTSYVTKVYNLTYQVGSGTKITLKWTLPTNVFGRLQDVVTGAVVDVPMLGAGSYVVTNPGTIKALKMTISYLPIKPPPPAPVLVFPSTNLPGVALNPKIVWRKSENALLYRLQVSKNAFFTLPVYDIYTYDTTFQVPDTITLLRGTTYYWKVTAMNTFGSNAAAYWKFTIALVGINDVNVKPTNFNLAQNYPNPFNPSTRIEYSVPVESRVNIEVYTVLGEKIATLYNGTVPAGVHSAVFDAKNLYSGMYLVRMEAKSGSQNFVQVRKMILMK